MTDEQPEAWAPLTPDQWADVPRTDHTALFTRDEVAAALRLLMPPDEAAEIVQELYDEPTEPGTVFFYGELLAALASLSDSAAERARSMTTGTERDETEPSS